MRMESDELSGSRLGLSIIVPMHDEEPGVGALLAALEETFAGTHGGWEVVAVDDGSRDGTWRVLREASAQRPWLRGVRLDGCFGQHPATIAGLEAAAGGIVATSDADMQVPPGQLKLAVEKVAEGADIAFMERDHSGEGFLREKIAPRVNRYFAAHSAGSPQRVLSTFLAAKREVVEAALDIEVSRPVVPYHLMLAGASKVEWVQAAESPRALGKSKYGMRRLLCLALDILFGYTDQAGEAIIMTLVAAAAGGAFLCVLGAVWEWSGAGVFAVTMIVAAGLWTLLWAATTIFLAAQYILRSRRAAPLYVLREAF